MKNSKQIITDNLEYFGFNKCDIIIRDEITGNWYKEIKKPPYSNKIYITNECVKKKKKWFIDIEEDNIITINENQISLFSGKFTYNYKIYKNRDSIRLTVKQIKSIENLLNEKS